MKKIIAIITIIISMAGFSVVGFTQEDTLDIPGVNMTVGLPTNMENLRIVLRGSGIEEVEEYLESKSAYVSIIDPEITFEYLIVVEEGEENEDFYDMDWLSQREIEQLVLEVYKENDLYYMIKETDGKKVEYKAENVRAEEINGTTYIRSVMIPEVDNEKHFIMYTTVKEGRFIMFYVSNNSGLPTEEQKAGLLQILGKTTYRTSSGSVISNSNDKRRSSGPGIEGTILGNLIVAGIAVLIVTLRIKKKNKQVAEGQKRINDLTQPTAPWQPENNDITSNTSEKEDTQEDENQKNKQ